MSLSPLPTFDALEADAWSRLTAAVRAAHDAFHTCYVATVDAEGLPQCRTVVLRDADRATAHLTFHTDRRSPKVAELTARPHATLLFYDAPAKLQLRLLCDVTLHIDDAYADARWDASRPASRLCYAAPLGSTAAVDFPPPAPTEPTPDARAHFCAVACHPRTIESLHLLHTGHRRARLTYSGPTRTAATWLTP